MTELQQPALPAAEMPTLASTTTATTTSPSPTAAATTPPLTPTGPPTPDSSSSGSPPTEVAAQNGANGAVPEPELCRSSPDVVALLASAASPTTTPQPPPPAAAAAAHCPPSTPPSPSSSSPPPPPARRFICGVVEGFYGRPWTTEQRKDLFRKLSAWGMDSYVYAPKDDYKHRAYWRELYTVEEGDHLAGLIAAAREHNIRFYYALSPGLDMTYSSPKEVATLKRKLEQVGQFGCDAFALLFDDIEPEMSKADRDVFQTFAHAQVTVTNECYHHLGAPRFLFCPTQYCATRAVPTVSASDYLLTLGSQLSLDIDILWTGSKVISKVLTQEQLHEITEVLRRPPVIWDNIHANDYDQKRVFLGPYSGRSPAIIPLLRGVLTNPNCEFHANAIAIHTLAHWSRCRTDGRRIADSLSAVDMRVEWTVDGNGGGGDGGCNGGADERGEEAEAEALLDDEDGAAANRSECYHPRVALRNAIRDWLPEFFRSKESYGPISKPHPAAVAVVMPVMPIITSVNTCMSLTAATATTATTTTASMVAPMKVAEVNTTQLLALAEVCSVVTGTDTITLPNLVMNSLVSSTSIVTNTAIPNPIVSAGIELQLPTVPVPVSSIGIPIANVSGGDYQVKVHEVAEEERRQDEPMAEEVEPKTMDTKLNGAAVDCLMSPAPPHVDISAGEPMEVSGGLMSPKLSSASKVVAQLDDVVMADGQASSSTASSSSSSMQVEGAADGAVLQSGDLPIASSLSDDVRATATWIGVASNGDEVATEMAAKQPIGADDISLMCDLFYLPFEHGNRALRLLNEFNWLKSNAAVLVNAQPPYRKQLADRATAKPVVQEWFERADRFAALGRSVLVLAKKLALCENRELAYELFAYVWDIAGVVTLLMGFVKWLSLGCFPATINSYTQGSYTWFSKGWRETFTSGDQEPWVFRGGLTADLQRLIPVDSGNDLFLYKLPDTPSTSFPVIRPYIAADQPLVYSICHRTCRDGSDCTDLFPPALQSIPADRLIGPFVTLTPELCLVVVEAGQLVGYACAALDAKQFYCQQERCWMPAMCAKYPLALLDQQPEQLTPTAAESIRHFHHFRYECPLAVLASHPSMMTCCVLKEQFIADQSVAKRLVTVLLAALRANGSSGVHACINGTDRFLHQFYAKLGFVELYQEPSGKVYMGRNF